MNLKRISLVTIAASLSLACVPMAPCSAAELTTFPLIPHHVQKARLLKERGIDVTQFDSHLRRRTEAAQMGSLYYGKGAHYADLWCGTPPQRQSVIIDTGSAVTAFPCSGCRGCGANKYHINVAFKEKDSSTFSSGSCDDCDEGRCSDDGQCIIDMFYEEGSFWKAFKAKDRCYFGGPHNAPLLEEIGTDGSIDSEHAKALIIDPEHAKALTIDLNFGCQTKVGGLFKTQLADGIMGMNDDKRSFWSQMYKSGKGGSENKFSLCLAPPRYDRGITEAGAMTLGGTDTRLHESPMIFASRKNKNGHYKVHIRKIYLRHGQGGESAQSIDPNAKLIPLDVNLKAMNQYGVIVDTGTTDTYFNEIISSQFREAFRELSGRAYNNKRWDLKGGELETLPTILIQLEGERGINKHLNLDPAKVVGLAGDMDTEHPHDVVLAIPPSHYMDLRSNGQYTPRIYNTGQATSVLGAIAMMGHDVLFDMDRQVVGWAKSRCNYHALVTGNGYKDVLEGELYRDYSASYSESSESISVKSESGSGDLEVSVESKDFESDSISVKSESASADLETSVESKPAESDSVSGKSGSASADLKVSVESKPSDSDSSDLKSPANDKNSSESEVEVLTTRTRKEGASSKVGLDSEPVLDKVASTSRNKRAFPRKGGKAEVEVLATETRTVEAPSIAELDSDPNLGEAASPSDKKRSDGKAEVEVLATETSIMGSEPKLDEAASPPDQKKGGESEVELLTSETRTKGAPSIVGSEPKLDEAASPPDQKEGGESEVEVLTKETRTEGVPSIVELDSKADIDQGSYSMPYEEDVNPNLQVMTDVRSSWYHRGYSLTVLCMLICAGCYIGKWFCQSTSLSADYKKLDEMDYSDYDPTALFNDPLVGDDSVCVELRRRSRLLASG